MFSRWPFGFCEQLFPNSSFPEAVFPKTDFVVTSSPKTSSPKKIMTQNCLIPGVIGKEEFYQSLFPVCVCGRRLLEKKSFIKFVPSVCLWPTAIGKEE